MSIRSAKNTLLSFGDTTVSPVTYATLAQQKSFSLSGPTATIPDVTTHNQSGYYMEKLAVLLDAGTIAVPVNFDPGEATHSFTAGFWDYINGLDPIALKITMPGTFGNIIGDGYGSNHGLDFPTDNVLQGNFEFAMTGALRWYA